MKNRFSAFVGLCLLLALFWLPFVIGLSASFTDKAEPIPEQYRVWWLHVRRVFSVILRGYFYE